MSIKPTLVVLAAGIGSRYGGLKHIDPIGPDGEIVIDYSIFDAIRAGFGKIGGGNGWVRSLGWDSIRDQAGKAGDLLANLVLQSEDLVFDE